MDLTVRSFLGVEIDDHHVGTLARDKSAVTLPIPRISTGCQRDLALNFRPARMGLNQIEPDRPTEQYRRGKGHCGITEAARSDHLPSRRQELRVLWRGMGDTWRKGRGRQRRDSPNRTRLSMKTVQVIVRAVQWVGFSFGGKLYHLGRQMKNLQRAAI
jgi:hypothetical protein